METIVMPEITEIIDIISKIKHIELISAEWKERVEKVYPNLNAFAKADIEVTEEITEDVFLALKLNPEKTHYTNLTSIKYLSTIGNRDIFAKMDLVEFEKPIAFGTNIDIRKATSEEQNIFDERHKNNIGTTAKLLNIVSINKVRYFVGYYQTVTPIFTYFPLFEVVDFLLANTSNIDNIISGGWSSWMRINEEVKELVNRAFPINIGGNSFTPKLYCYQVVNGTNYKVRGYLSNMYLPIYHIPIILHFYVSNDNIISNVNITYL